VAHLARCLAEGFDYQGEASQYRDGRRRGEPSASLPPTAFVSFLQNHDQVGNRAFGDRVTTLAPERVVRCLTAILLLAPQPPLLFMGQEFGAGSPFQFFCDFEPELAAAVVRGRRAEFARFARFASAAERQKIPDPNDRATFERSRLDWTEIDKAGHAAWLEYHRELLAIRRRDVTPLLPRLPGGSGHADLFADTAFAVLWSCDNGARLTLVANLGEGTVTAPPSARGRLLHAMPDEKPTATDDRLEPWSTRWYLRDAA
jgi:1,4-alpha-glucan branching enzyme